MTYWSGRVFESFIDYRCLKSSTHEVVLVINYWRDQSVHKSMSHVLAYHTVSSLMTNCSLPYHKTLRYGLELLSHIYVVNWTFNLFSSYITHACITRAHWMPIEWDLNPLGRASLINLFDHLCLVECICYLEIFWFKNLQNMFHDY